MTDLLEPGEATLLLVDDRPENLLALEAVLAPTGHRLVTATSGEEALKRLLVEDVSVLLLDVHMPGMDGIETARAVKGRDRTADIPIIFLTAHAAQGAEVLEAFSSGAVDYITKPFDPALLRAKVQVFVDLSHKTRMLRRESAELARKLDERYASEARHLRKLAGAALAINSTQSLDEMLQVITDSALEVIGAHHADLLAAAGEGEPRRRAWAHSAKYERWSPESGELSTVQNAVREHGGPVRMTKKEIEAVLAAHGVAHVGAGHPALEGWLAAPLVGRTGRRLGLIQVADKVAGDFTDDDEVVLVQLAQLAAVAIENAERFQQEHAIAEELQRSLLPDVVTSVGGCRFAARYFPGGAGTQVGGDWYDVIPLDDGRVLLVVGDVVGRGARAAAVMGQLRTAIRAYALQQLPGTVLVRSLDRLLQDVTEGAIATCVVLVVDPATMQLEVISAGHPPPLVLEPDGSARYLECDPHTPLGVLPAPVYTPTLLTVVPGSTLLLYTDGLVEDAERAVDDGMRALLAAARDSCGADVEALCDAVLATMVGDDSSDDVALLAARLGA